MRITRATHSMDIVDERNGHALIEITEDSSDIQRDKRFYVVSINRSSGQVTSSIPEDCPDSGLWVSNLTVGGVAYVANGRTRATARRWFKKLADEQME